MSNAPPNALCLGSSLKGDRFWHRSRREGARAFLLTIESVDDLFVPPELHEPDDGWRRIDERGAEAAIGLNPCARNSAGRGPLWRPENSAFGGPEVFHGLDQKHHIGLVVCSSREERVGQLLDGSIGRIIRDYQAVLPPANRATA